MRDKTFRALLSNLPRFFGSRKIIQLGTEKYFLSLGVIIVDYTYVEELVNLKVQDIQDAGESLITKIPNTKTKVPKTFVMINETNRHAGIVPKIYCSTSGYG